jgi:hypothetical protein
VSSRSLGRSLDPLPGEALNGFLLRLSFRLRLSPARLARLAGIAAPYGYGLPRRLLLDVDVGSLAAFARLSMPEASALTLLPWADRYPPAARSLRTAGQQPQADDWLFAPEPVTARAAWPATAALFRRASADAGNFPGSSRSRSPALSTGSRSRTAAREITWPVTGGRRSPC